MEPTYVVLEEGPYYARGASHNAPGQWWRVGDGAVDVLHECSLTMMRRQVAWGAFAPSTMTHRFGVESLSDLEIFMEGLAFGIRERIPAHQPGVYPLMSPVTPAEARQLVQGGAHASTNVRRHINHASG